MEAAICTLVSEFQKYAKKDGSSSTLSKAGFDSLVTSQLSNYVKNASERWATLDENSDEELTFAEFWQLIGTLAAEQGGFSL